MNTHCETTNCLPISQSQSHTPNRRLVELFNLLGEKIGKTLKSWHQRNKEQQELNHLSDRDLKDIGLTRIDLKRSGGTFFWNS